MVAVLKFNSVRFVYFLITDVSTLAKMSEKYRIYFEDFSVYFGSFKSSVVFSGASSLHEHEIGYRGRNI